MIKVSSEAGAGQKLECGAITISVTLIFLHWSDSSSDAPSFSASTDVLAAHKGACLYKIA